MKTKEKVFMKRKVEKKTGEVIADEAWNLQGERPFRKVVRTVQTG